MYTNLIVGIDGALGGRNAAALAASLMNHDAHTTLVYVSVRSATRHGAVELELADDDALHATLHRELGLVGGHAEVRWISAGSVGAGLEEAARDAGSDLIVVGASAKHGISRLVADDVKSLLHQTPCAIAVAPASYEHTPDVRARVGVAFDGSPESHVAVAHAGMLAAERRSEIVLRHVVSPRYYATGVSPVMPAMPSSADLIRAAETRLPDAYGLPVEHVCGLRGEKLLEFSTSVDLLVCGSRRQGLLRRLASGSTSGYLASHSRAPLLVAPTIDMRTLERWEAQCSVIVS